LITALEEIKTMNIEIEQPSREQLNRHLKLLRKIQRSKKTTPEQKDAAQECIRIIETARVILQSSSMQKSGR
jgi:hypothetical protein